MTIIVSRHPAAVAFVRATAEAQYARFCEENNVQFESFVVVEQATSDLVAGQIVYGNLPLHLACLAHKYFAIEMPDLSRSERGKEMTADEMRAAGARIVEYSVRRITD